MDFIVKHGITLPIRVSPIRFAVQHKNGLSSNSWRVWTRSSGDAYVKCRDNFAEVKASLHQSGRNRIAFTSESGNIMSNGNRVWNEWHRPSLDQDTQIAPMLSILLPDWSLAVPYSCRRVRCVVEQSSMLRSYRR